MSTYLGTRQILDWASPSRIFATTTELFDSQPNYEHGVAIALDTGIKYQGAAPQVGGWGLATGAPPPPPFPPEPLGINDGYTKICLEFEGLENSTTYVDTNASGWPTKWTQVRGFGHITNVGELLNEGSLRMDGQTVITAPDRVDFEFREGEFSVHAKFQCEAPLGFRRNLMAKTDYAVNKRMFWIDRLGTGEIEAGIGSGLVTVTAIQDRSAIDIVDRAGEIVVDRLLTPSDSSGGVIRTLVSVTKFSDTLNTGPHTVSFRRVGNVLQLLIDDIFESTVGLGSPTAVEMVNYVVGPITIGGYGPPKGGAFVGGTPWLGLLDRINVDIGIGR